MYPDLQRIKGVEKVHLDIWKKMEKHLEKEF